MGISVISRIYERKYPWIKSKSHHVKHYTDKVYKVNIFSTILFELNVSNSRHFSWIMMAPPLNKNKCFMGYIIIIQ